MNNNTLKNAFIEIFMRFALCSTIFVVVLPRLDSLSMLGFFVISVLWILKGVYGDLAFTEEK